MKLKSLLATGTFLLLGVSTLKAQGAAADPAAGPAKLKFVERLSFGLSFGSNLTYTDLKQYDYGLATKYHSEIGWGGGINGSYALNSIFALQLQVNYATINGTHRLGTGTSDKKHKASPNHYFTGNLFDYTFDVNVNLTKLLFNPKRQLRKYYVYAYAGTGITSFRSVRYKLVNDNDSDPILSYEGYNGKDLKNNKVDRTNEVFIPLGLGLRYKLNSNWSVTVETSGRYMQSDKLDAFVAGKAKDAYQLSTLGVVYNFSAKIDEPESKTVIEDLAKMNELIDGFGDKDGDGVADRYDKDQNTPAGVKAYADGTSVDSDGDGVADYLDKEKFSNAGAKVDENGVESDADGDHVADSRDLEPNTAKGAQVDVAGVTIKTGGATSITGGTGSGSSYNATSLPSIYFDVNSSKLDYKSYDALTTIAKAMKSNANVKLVVVGHCDAQGSADFNQKLGLKRAEAVVAYLVKVYGIDKSRLSADTKGSSDRLTKQKNSMADRRVDIMSK
ncbi:MAG: OmpA family protein [Flavobacteriales bacterium]